MLSALWFAFYGVTFNAVVQAISALFEIFRRITPELFLIVILLSCCVSFFSTWVEVSVQARLKRNRLFQRFLRHQEQVDREFSGKVRTVYSIGLIKVFRFGLGFEFLKNLSLLFKVFLFIPAFIFLDGLRPEALAGLSLAFPFQIDPFSFFEVYGIRVLPVLMFVLSTVSGLMYLKDAGASRNRHIVLSLLFLVLLYPAKSILVVYWCFNIIFSAAFLWLGKRKTC